MDRSVEIHELASALAKAQGAIQGATKSNVNPAFRSKYADLASVWDACRGPLSANGLSITQIPAIEEGGRVAVTTVLLHATGQWISSVLSVQPAKTDAQGIGSAITYLRRYGLSAMVGVAPEDDDGNAASEQTPKAKTAPASAPQVPEGYDDWLSDITAAADTGMDALGKAWQAAKPEYRKHAGMATLDTLKARAAKSTTEAA